MSEKFKFNSSKKKERMRLTSENMISVDRINGAHIELFSNKEILIDGCNSIYDFNDSYIHLNLGKYSLILYGNCLSVISFEEKTIDIKGNIISLEFCERRTKC